MSESYPNPSVAATYCATLVDEWSRGALTDAVVCPGSRSTPMALALDADDRIRVHVHPDERSAGFMALGLANSTGRPVVVVTTSGTAAVELHPAAVEAHHSNVPLILCTADRPPELQGVGAPQTIDQTNLFGDCVRAHFNPGPPDPAHAESWRSLASRVLLGATGPEPGPVHLNLAFREPLVGVPMSLPAGRADGTPWLRRVDTTRVPTPSEIVRIVQICSSKRGVIVAGASIDDPTPVLDLGRRLGWPVFADPRSGCRIDEPGAGPKCVVMHFDSLLRADPGASDSPEVVLMLGQPPASKVLDGWLREHSARRISIDRYGRTFDPSGLTELMIEADPTAVCETLLDAIVDLAVDPSWGLRWTDMDSAAREAVSATVGAFEYVTEALVARSLLDAMPTNATLVVSSSMPVRELEWFSGGAKDVRVLANRGVNGIDGVVSTAVGVALSGTRTALLIGDLAFLHDVNGLVGIRDRDIDLTVVVVDNDGGGIFSFLPQGRELPPDRFERLFATPHGVDLATCVAAHGIDAKVVDSVEGLNEALGSALGGSGVHVLIVETRRGDNVGVHAALDTAVAAAVAQLP